MGILLYLPCLFFKAASHTFLEEKRPKRCRQVTPRTPRKPPRSRWTSLESQDFWWDMNEIWMAYTVIVHGMYMCI